MTTTKKRASATSKSTPARAKETTTLKRSSRKKAGGSSSDLASTEPDEQAAQKPAAAPAQDCEARGASTAPTQPEANTGGQSTSDAKPGPKRRRSSTKQRENAPADDSKSPVETKPTAKPSTNPKAAARTRRPKSPVSLADLATRYILHLDAAGKSASTVASYRADLMIATGFLGGETAITSLTPKQIAAFNESDAVMRTRSELPKAAPTWKKTRRVLRLALGWACDEGLLDAPPLPDASASE